MFNPIGHRTRSRDDGWIPTSMHESVNDFHFERLPIAPIRGKAFPSGTRPHLPQVAATSEVCQGLLNNHGRAKERRKA